MIGIQNKKFILASSSPRRKEMFEASGISFEVIVANIDEKPKDNEGGHQYAQRNAKEKGLAVCKQYNNNEIILSADTIVVTKEDKILEKPLNEEQARNMLRMLSGNTHLVLSGYSLFQNNKELISRIVETHVTFRILSDFEINSYINTKEPFDKSGAYGIQGRAMGFIQSIHGSYTNVMGLPLSEVLIDLKNFAGIESFSSNK